MPVGGNFTNCNCGPAVDACQSPTEPVATVGLCLPDGTPIAVTIVRDCAGGTVQEGWLNLTSGAWSAGQPPAGTIACGDSRSIQVSGTFCDIAPDTGDVLGLVLIEYSYAADGSIAGVRLVDAVTGATYTPQGEVTTCPAGVEQPERDLVTLCDVSDDESGTLETVPFLRDYQRDENGQVVGHSDYTLDGGPYTPTGQVGSCQPDEPCASSVTVLRLCDLNPDVAPDDEGRRCAVPFLRHLVYDCDGALIETRDTAMDGTTPYTPVQVVDCGDGGVPALVEVPWDVVDIQPDPASEDGLGLIFSLSPVDDPSTVGTVTVTTSSVYNPASCPTEPPEYSYRNPTTYTFTPDQVLRDAATYVRCDLIDFDTFEPVTALTPPPDRLGGTAYWDGATVRPTESNGTGEMYYDGPPETWSYRVGNTGGGNSCSMLSFSAVSLRPEGCCGCDTGTAEDPCRDSTALLLCDVPSDGADGSPTAADTDPTGYPNSTAAYQCVNPVAGGGAALWSGGALTVPADTTAAGTCNATVNEQVLRGVAATLQADRPACDSGEATVTVSLRFREDGPSPTAANYRGGLRIHRADTGARLAGAMLAADALPEPSPVGYQETLTVSATVPAALLAAGQIVVMADVETFEGGAGGNGGAAWTLDEFTASYAFAQDGCATQFLRTVLTDCQTGQVVSVTDTTLDGEPYEVTGEAAQCAPAGGGDTTPEPCRDSSSVLLCDADAVASDVAPAVADASLADIGAGTSSIIDLPGGYGPLWAGEEFTFPADPDGTAGDGTQVYRAATGRITAAVPGTCDAGVGTVTVSTVVTLDGPSPGAGFVGVLRLYKGGTVLGAANVPTSPPVGYSGTLTVSAPVTATDLTSGDLYAALILETYHQGPKAWTAADFTVTGTLDGCRVQFLRHQVIDCNTGTVVSSSDTTLDGQPYTPTGTVGQCVPAAACCDPVPPERRVDVETELACLTDQASGEVLARVLLERVYDDQTGELADWRVTDPMTGAAVEVPDGAVVGSCEPPCPTAFATECVGIVARSEASYDNTSLIGGEPGQCGSVQGPSDITLPGQGAMFACGGGPYTITSWVVDGVEVIADGIGRTFDGGPCGPGDATTPGMHTNWAEALTNLDPTGATWVVDSAPACAWFVRSEGGSGTVYGSMTITGDGAVVTDGTWVLGPAQACNETQYTKVYRQDCDGSVSVVWLDQAGTEIAPPEGVQVPCGTGCSPSGGQGLDVEVLTLCDVQADGTSVAFLRHLTYDTGGAVSLVVDTALDGFAPYTPSGTVGTCSPEPAPHMVEECRCDDTNGDGIGDTDYVEILTVAADGSLTSVGTYTVDMTGPYSPVSPVPCPVGGGPVPEIEAAPVLLCDVAGDGTSTLFIRHMRYTVAGQVVGAIDTAVDGTTAYTPTGTVGVCAAEPPDPAGAVVRTGAERLGPGASVDYTAAYPGLQSITMTVLAGSGTAAMSTGSVQVPAGASLTWSVVDTDDSALDAATLGADPDGDVLVHFTYKDSGSG